MQDSQQLVSHLFSLLSWCLEVDDKLMSSFEYIQQLILTSLLNICTTWGLHNTRAIPAANFNVELIVKCVRISTNPHTHQTALLLLSSAAAVFPTHILHNVMPIFTFMGASLLRRDDQYSLHVIKKTVDIIIPALIKSGSMKRSSTLLSTVTDIIRVFVDAVPHVPHHRRLPLFSHLLSTIGPQDYLYIALGLLVEKHVVLPTGKELASDEAHLDGKFMAALSREHGPLVQLLSCLKLLEYLRNLPEDKPENARKARQLPASVTLLFNIALHSQKQLRQFKYSLVSLVNTVLSGLSYPDIQRSQDMKDEDKKQLIMRIFREALYYTTSLSQSQTHSSDEATNRFWQAMLKRTCDTIDGVTSLLTLDPFLSIVYQLLVETEGDVQKKSLSMLNTKLESLKNRHLNSQVDATLLEVVDVVMGVALTESVAMTTRQNALYSLKLLIQRLASQHNDKFIKVTGSLLDILEQHSELVCSDGLLCIAELCLALVARVIPLLPRILACFMTYCGQVTDGKEQLHISALSSLCVVVETLPQFLSSTLPDMVVKSCHSHLVNNNCTQLTQQASKLRKLLANQIPARVFLPAIVKCYNALWDSSKSSVMALVDMLSVSIERLTREEVRSHSQIMVDTFLVMLDYRSVKQGVELTSILEVEKSVINSLACLVIKLSEASFRPIFLKLLDWSTHLDSHRKRAITFYHLTNIIAEKLKSLFLLFAGHLVQNAAELLDACNDSKQDELYFEDQIDHSDEERTEMTTLLLRFILDTLHKCLLYDKGSFLTKNNFKTLLKPLVDQVSNHHGGDACYQDRVSHQLVACVSQLAVAAGKDTLWKQLNNELLLITRHSKPEVKIAVLKIVREIYSKLGEEFTVLLPETIPFLAELMEDESLDVEKQAHTVIVLIEEIVGESVQQYF